jgi:hypothetical protein
MEYTRRGIPLDKKFYSRPTFTVRISTSCNFAPIKCVLCKQAIKKGEKYVHTNSHAYDAHVKCVNI